MRENAPPMLKRAISLIVSLIFIPFTEAFSQPSQAETLNGTDREPMPQIETRVAIPAKEEVKILRAEKTRKMPYIDRSFLKETLNSKTVQAKESFVEKEVKDLNAVTLRAMEVYTPAKAAKERISLAKRRILVAARELLPSTDFNFEFRNGSLSGDAFSGKDYHVNFKVPIFRGGILWNTFLQEKSNFRAARKEYDEIINELIDEVARAYFEFNRAREVFDDKKRTAEIASKQHSLSKSKFEQALISEIEYLNVESIAGQMDYEIESAEQELELAKMEIQRYLGLDASDPVEVMPLYHLEELIQKVDQRTKAVITESVKSGRSLPQELNEFIDLAYQNRPELQVESEKLKAARYEARAKQGAFLPRADITMEFGELGEAFTRNVDDPTTQPEWRLLLEVSQNIFGNKMKYSLDNDENAPAIAQFLGGSGTQVTKHRFEVGALNGLQDFVETKEAKIKKLEQIITLEKKEQEVIREVKEAYFEYHKASIQVDSTLKRNQYRKRLVELSKIRMSKAEIEISEYLQAELDLAEERKKLHSSLADYFKAKSKLNKAIGIRDYLPLEDRYEI